MKDYTTTYVGLDAHKKNHQLYIIFPNGKKPESMTINNTSHDIRRFVRSIQKKAPGPIRICYEAGPCGFDLKRQLETTGTQGKAFFCPGYVPEIMQGENKAFPLLPSM